MKSSEVLAFLPLLIYGFAIAELFRQWKRIIDFKHLFLPYTLFTLVLTEIALYNVFLYSKLVPEISGLTYFNYMIYLLPPFLFMITVYVFTPEKEDDTKEYFIAKMPIFFFLISLFIATHFIFEYQENMGVKVGRIIGIILIMSAGISRKIWLTYLVFALWLIVLIFRGFVVSA